MIAVNFQVMKNISLVTLLTWGSSNTMQIKRWVEWKCFYSWKSILLLELHTNRINLSRFKFGDTLAIRKPNQYSLNYSCQSGQIEEIGDSKNWLFSANKKDDKIYEFHYELKKLSAKITFDCRTYPHKEMLVSWYNHP